MDVQHGSSAPDLSERGVVTALVSILEHNGTVLLADLGGLLGATLGPESTRVVKKEFKGLKTLLQNHSALFQLSGKAPLLQAKLVKQPIARTQATPISKAPSVPPTLSGAKNSAAPGSKDVSVSLKQYLTDIKTHLAKGGWKQVGKLLRVRRSPISASLSKSVTPAKENPQSLNADVQSLINGMLSDVEEVDWARVVSLHLLVCYHYNNSNYKLATHLQTELNKCFDLYWRSYPPSADFNPKKQSPMDVWRVILFEARQIAIWADLSLESAGQEATLLLGFQNYLRPLAKVFEKSPGLLLLQNTILRIYTHTNTTSNFNTVLKVMQPQTIDTKSYPVSDVVTWSFFIGRYNLYQGDYANAVPLLRRAFSSCPSSYKRNKQLILTYLIPANAMTGTYPKKALLEQYQLMEYYELIEGVKHGNYKRYQNAMDHFDRAFDRGVYMPLRRLTTILFRNLFKKTALVYASTRTEVEKAKPQLPIMAFNTALTLSGYDTKPEETSCIITNLISTKKVRGYISYEHQLVVLAPGAGAFPSLAIK